ncbi:TrlF family AAA-like ATPase [Leucobacter luti]|uniref:TrlF family AAA-like ATPase n=1 Tax=Leucobacter luti TaxID=340320 RepID=UPI001C69303F|nr:AAA family ATPase [Leucobacter luti]QYM76466.1 AAA family ATPase [Leucobacter luti]
MGDLENPSGAGHREQALAGAIVGAKWWSLDIHAHSPKSFDYGGLEGDESTEPAPSFEEWVRSYIDAGVDGIVVADHNSHEGIDAARQALESLRAADPDLPSFVIFPGVELTLSGGYHALAIFDHESEAEIVLETLALCKFTGTRGRSDHVANLTANAAAEVVHNKGGLFIPAHIDQARGVLLLDSRELKALSESPHIIAAEVADDAKVDEATKLGWVPILGSDAHHLTTEGAPDPAVAKAPGTHLTMVKAEALTLEGIRLALAEPSESIRRARRGDPDLNEVKHDHIKAITVRHKDVVREYALGPWMNCLIGGRGVGKSTLVELLRLAHGRAEELPAALAADLVRFSPIADSGERWWNDQTEIEVTYWRGGQLLRIVWAGASPASSTIELWDGSAWTRQSGRVVDRAPVRVFSQKQIYELASKPQSFLQMLDDMPEIRKAEWEEQYEELRLKFKNERNNLRQLLAESEKADRLNGELQEVQARLRHLDTIRASAEYAELSQLEAKIQSIASSKTAISSVESTVTDQAAALRALPTGGDSSPEYLAYVSSFGKAAALLEQAAGIIGAARQAWAAADVEEGWRAELSRLSAWVNEQGGASTTSVEQTSQDRQRETELRAELEQFENAEARRDAQEKVIAGIRQEVQTKRNELFERRKGCADRLNTTQGTRTKLQVFEQASVVEVGDELRTLLQTPDSFESAFAQDGLPSLISNKVPQDPRFSKDVPTFKEKLVAFVELGQQSELAAEVKINARFYTRLASVDTFDLVTDIMLWFPEDLIRVMYQANGKADFIAVDRGSPGQKTAALLAVILQMGNEPLLLDQPEDDLENKLIRYLAVETLKKIKQGRQLIVSTHNANVVVTSGAENILVLEHKDTLPAIEASGTLQQAVVKENVREILEGGEEAIRTRFLRLVGDPN